MKAKKSRKENERSVGPHGTFTPPPNGAKAGHHKPAVATGGESKKHPGNPKHGKQLFHGSS